MPNFFRRQDAFQSIEDYVSNEILLTRFPTICLLTGFETGELSNKEKQEAALVLLATDEHYIKFTNPMQAVSQEEVNSLMGRICEVIAERVLMRSQVSTSMSLTQGECDLATPRQQYAARLNRLLWETASPKLPSYELWLAKMQGIAKVGELVSRVDIDASMHQRIQAMLVSRENYKKLHGTEFTKAELVKLDSIRNDLRFGIIEEFLVAAMSRLKHLPANELPKTPMRKRPLPINSNVMAETKAQKAKRLKKEKRLRVAKILMGVKI